MKYILFIIVTLTIVACENETKKFPFSEEEMVQNKMYGILLDYTLFDTTKTDFVDDILCDTITKNENLIFSKIITEIEDSSYFFFHMYEYEPIINDYIGMLYVDIDRFDSIYMYGYYDDFRYSTNDFIKLIKEIATHNKSTVEETIKHRKVNNSYIPHFYFVVRTNYSDCENGFTKQVIWITKQINNLMNDCVIKILKNENIEITPYIEFQSGLKDTYKRRHILSTNAN